VKPDITEELALQLIRLGAKTQVTQYATGLSEWTVRRLWKECRDDAPRRGIVPELSKIVRTRQQQLEAALFVAIYVLASDRNVFREVDFNAWVRSHELYLRMRTGSAFEQNKSFDINATFRVVTSLRQGDNRTQLRSCQNCRSYYFDTIDMIDVKCPVCDRGVSRRKQQEPCRRPPTTIGPGDSIRANQVDLAATR